MVKKQSKIIILIAIAVLVVGGVFYSLRMGKLNDTTLPPMEVSPAGRSIGFESSIGGEVKDYEKARSFLADEVNFIIEGTECCGTVNRDSVNLGYGNEGLIYFSQDQTLVKQIKGSSGGEGIVGIMSEGDLIQYIVYTVNESGQVDSVYFGFTAAEYLR